MYKQKLYTQLLLNTRSRWKCFIEHLFISYYTHMLFIYLLYVLFVTYLLKGNYFVILWIYEFLYYKGSLEIVWLQ